MDLPMLTPSPESTPAVLGGTPVRPEGPPDWPMKDDEVLQSLQAAYTDGSWGRYDGPHGERLQEQLTAYHEGISVTTCGSGTYAVEVALRALKIVPGDEVVLAGYDYEGNFLAVHAVGATPVLVEIDADNWNLNVDALTDAVGPRTRAVIVSHLHGGLAPMREVMETAARHRLRVIEDAAQAPGACVQGRKAGTWGDVGILSFGGSKLLCAGRGGALLSRHADVHQRLRVLLHRGNNICPLSELQAAVLLPQLKKLDACNARRAANVAKLLALLADVPGLRPFLNNVDASWPSYYKLGFQYDARRFGLPRERFVAALQAEGIAFSEGFRGLHVQRSPSRYRRVGMLTEVERAHHGVVVLHHPVLLGGDAEIEQIASAVRKIYANADKLRG
jgi:dTDP-4-amino-4,6-dideoxygalactose transaminase